MLDDRDFEARMRQLSFIEEHPELSSDSNPTEQYISYAESNGNLQTLRRLEAAGIRETSLKSHDNFLLDRTFDLAFRHQCQIGDLEGALKAIASGVDINSIDADSDTPLMIAAAWNHADIVQVLLDVGADPSMKNKQGHTALTLARDKGAKKALDILCTEGSDRPTTPTSAERSHRIDLEWKQILVNKVKKIPKGREYSYYSDEAFEDSLYHDSTYVCPTCSIERQEDGTPIYPILMKLEIERTTTEHNGDCLTLSNLFTCCNCHCFFASVHEINDHCLTAENHDAPDFPAGLALTSCSYNHKTWKAILKRSEKLTESPSKTEVVTAPRKREEVSRLDSFAQTALLLLGYLLAIKNNELVLTAITRIHSEDSVSKVDTICRHIITALATDGHVKEGTELGDYPPIRDAFDSIPKMTLIEFVMTPLYYSNKCMVYGSSKVSDRAFMSLFSGFVDIQMLYDEWSPQELAGYLGSCFQDGDDIRRKGADAVNKRLEKMGKPVSRDLSKESKGDSSKGGCYIATAAYGSYDCPQVWTLRRYRDYHLAETAPGRAFIKTYYAISPTIVRWFGNNKLFNSSTRSILDKFVAKCQEKGYSSEPYDDQSW